MYKITRTHTRTDKTPEEWHYSQQYIFGMLQSSLFFTIGVVSMFMTEHFTILDSPVITGCVWGIVGYQATLIYVVFSDQGNFDDKLHTFISLLWKPKNLILIGTIWIFVGTLLTSIFKLSPLAVILSSMAMATINNSLVILF